MPTVLRLAPLGIAALLLASACSEESAAAPSAPAAAPSHAPALTKELVPPLMSGLVPGVATEADVTAVFAASETVKDKSLGGTAKVEYGEKPAIRATFAPKDAILRGEAWFVPDDGGGPARLQRIELVTKEPGTCKWIVENVGKDPEASRRIGSNRKFGELKGGANYSGGSPDGKQPVDIECHPSTRDGAAIETVVYGIVSPGGSSMRVQTE